VSWEELPSGDFFDFGFRNATYRKFSLPIGKSLFGRLNFLKMSAPPPTLISPDMTMSAVLATYPGARRALFAKYHIGGCRSCGFTDDETLAQVCARNDNLNPAEVVADLETSRGHDAQMQLAPAALAEALQSPVPPKLLDVRSREEHEAVHLAGDTFLTQELMQEIFGSWAPDTALVLYCHKGDRSLDLAAYFQGHGFKDTKCLAGGIDAWSCDVDQTVPRYNLELE
jgi:rhodanese-related sulfurtransferase